MSLIRQEFLREKFRISYEAAIKQSMKQFLEVKIRFKNMLLIFNLSLLEYKYVPTFNVSWFN